MQYAQIQSLLTHWHNKRYLYLREMCGWFSTCKTKSLVFSCHYIDIDSRQQQQRCPWEDQDDELSEAAHDDDDNSTMIQQHQQSHQRWDLWISFLCKLWCHEERPDNHQFWLAVNQYYVQARAGLPLGLRSRKMISWSIELIVIVTSLLSISDRCHQWMRVLCKFLINAHNFDTSPTSSLFPVIQFLTYNLVLGLSQHFHTSESMTWTTPLRAARVFIKVAAPAEL